MKKKLFIGSTAFILIVIIGLLYYNQSHISIWGFNISKNDLNRVVIMTTEKNYEVTDPKYVLELSTELSKMKKLNKIEPNNWPPNMKHPKEFVKISIQTKKQVTYGGSFWLDDNTLIIDGNGYYWSVSNDLFDLMDKSLNGAKTISEFKGD